MPAGVAKAEPLFSRTFILICLTTLITSTAFYLLLTTLPMYVVKLGGHEADVGLVIGALTISAVIFRPFIGVQSDRHGRRIILRIGIAGFLVAMALYAISASVPSLILLRVFHGVFWAALSTALSTLIADIAPLNRRGEAMGYYGVSSILAMAIGPALGIAIVTASSFSALFLVCTTLSLLALFIALSIPETQGTRDISLALDRAKGYSSMLTLEIIFPAMVVFFVTTTYGAVISFLPLYAKGFQVDNPGLFFTIYAVVVLLSRPLAGRLSDRFGRGAVIIPGIALIAVAMAVLSLSGSMPMLVLVGILFGLGFGGAQPALMAFAVDRVPDHSRGMAMGYFTAAFDTGISAGAMVMGFVVQSMGYGFMYMIAALSAFIGVSVFVAREHRTVLAPRASLR